MKDKIPVLSQRKNLLLFLALIISPVVISIILANLFLKNPSPENTQLLIEAAKKTNNKQKVAELYSQIVQKNPLHIDFHYEYIQSWFDSRKFDENLDDFTKEKIYEEYFERSQDSDSQIRDIGYYGLGLIASINKKYDDALSFFEGIQNSRLKYLNNSIGYVYYVQKEYIPAEEYFRIEIKNRGNLSGAVSNLSRLLYEMKRYEELDALSQNPDLSQYVSQGTKRLITFHQGKWGEYIQYIFRYDFKYLNLAGFLGALLATFVWYFFLRNLDVFEPEKHHYLFLTFLLGAVISPFCLIFYDAAHYWFQFDATGHWFNDLMYCVFGIGLFEELVKVTPLLLILFFTREINESIDFIIYASLGALGFAFMENILYFSESHLYVMEGRSLISALFHMVTVSLVGYGIFLGKSKKFGKPVSNFFFFFLLACLLHGVFDYWIICKTLPRYLIQLSFLTAIFSVILYNRMIVNSLNQSQYFDQNALHKLREMRMYLGVALISIVIFQYWVLAVKFGHELATLTFLKRSMFTLFIIYIFGFHLSRLELKKNAWLDWGDRGYDKTIEIVREPTTHFQIEKLSEEHSVSLFSPYKFIILQMAPLLLLCGTLLLLIEAFSTDEKTESNFIKIMLFFLFLMITIVVSIAIPVIYMKKIIKIVSRRHSRLFDPDQPDTFLIRMLDMDKELKRQKGEVGILKIDQEKKACFFEGEIHRFYLPVDAIQSATIYEYFARRKGFAWRLNAVLSINTFKGVASLGFGVINLMNVIHGNKPLLDFIKLLKETASPESEKEEKRKIENALRFDNIEVKSIPPESAGKILTKKTIYNLILFAILDAVFYIFYVILIVTGFAFLCLSYLKYPEFPVPSFIGYPAGFLMFGCGVFLFIKINFIRKKDKSLEMRYLMKRCIRIMKERHLEDLFVSPDDPEKILVEIVPRYNWGKMMLENASDVGFLKLDIEKKEILYEGDNIRFRIPSETILSCNMEKAIRLSSCFHLIVIKVKIYGGRREFCLRRRLSAIFRSTRDKEQKQLFEQITAMMID
ncbi:PrsW family intramembrane metalloprotease [Candidatus Sumerlaeota bacterium]|nr:PrsW family intramembrane metalloprotease [Candidatus Sumerlaeota bacterium]